MSSAAGPPFPKPSLAFSLALTALLVSSAPLLAGGSAVSVAFCGVLAYGGIGVLAARLVPEPAAERIGLTPFPLRALAPILLLAPAVLLVSELDNWIRIAFGAPPSAALGVVSLPPPEEIVLVALLSPVLEEFFFRGVLLQGCVSALGRWRGVLCVALLQIVLAPVILILDAAVAPKPQTALIVSQGLATLVFGLGYGLVRLATRSLLPSIALSSLVTSLGVAAGALSHRAPIPGFNAPGTTTPLVYLILAAASVALGVWLLTDQLAREPALPPIPPPAREDDEEPGSLF